MGIASAPGSNDFNLINVLPAVAAPSGTYVIQKTGMYPRPLVTVTEVACECLRQATLAAFYGSRGLAMKPYNRACHSPSSHLRKQPSKTWNIWPVWELRRGSWRRWRMRGSRRVHQGRAHVSPNVPSAWRCVSVSISDNEGYIDCSTNVVDVGIDLGIRLCGSNCRGNGPRRLYWLT